MDAAIFPAETRFGISVALGAKALQLVLSSVAEDQRPALELSRITSVATESRAAFSPTTDSTRNFPRISA